MNQVWLDLLFMHWPVSSAEIARHLPPGLEVDTFNGQAWIAVVPFRMRDVRPRWTPSLPGLSHFPELNVRTYVERDGKPGVWFFSLDAGNALAVQAARSFYSLPYFRAKVRCTREDSWIDFACRRTDARAEAAGFEGRYRPIESVEPALPGSLDHFLTERYCLYTADSKGRILRAEIHHKPWPLHRAEAVLDECSYLEAAGFDTPAGEPLLHFSPRVDVAVWRLQACG
jgi:uncharacterized protein YqjF (DUF2071 family)